MDSYSDASSSEDTAFYEELTRQILMLTDEDDDMGTKELQKRPVVGVGSRSVPRNVNYYGWSETRKSTSSVPSWMEGLWANTGVIGTGVFIPSGGSRVAATHTGSKKSGRRRYHNNNNNKGRKNNDRGSRMYSGAGQMIHG